LRIIRTDDAADIRFDAASENCIFYISPMYEFSHALCEAVFLFALKKENEICLKVAIGTSRHSLRCKKFGRYWAYSGPCSPARARL
jgi:hypothetical protein